MFQISFAQKSESIYIPSKKVQKEFETAKKYYSKNELDKAITAVDNCIKEDPFFGDAYIMKASIMVDLNDYCAAVELFDKAAEVLNLKYAGNLYDLYRFSVECGDYQKAKEKLLMMKDESDKRRYPVQLVDSLLEITSAALEIMKNPLQIEMKRIDYPVNSNINEYITAISADEKKLFFTRSYEDTTYIGNEQIIRIVDEVAYIAERNLTEDLSIWDTVYKFDEFYPQFADGRGITISPDGNTIFFVGCGWRDGYGSCDIYCSYRIGNNWTNPVNLGSNVNSKYWETQPYMSSDGYTLYFVSNRPGGYGKSDIWYSVMDEDGNFGEAKNLGDRVNTSGDERTPFIHFDARTLYFSSDGHPGLGGMDLFKIDLKNHEDKATNLGYPINDKSDQQCFLVSPDGTTAYVSSAAESGNFDIYCYLIPEEIRPVPVICIEGYVFDIVTGGKLNALVELVSTSNSNLLSSINTANDGHFVICIEDKVDFGITVSADGYMIYSDNSLSAKNISEIFEIGLHPLEDGKDIIARNIVFAHDSYELESVSYVELNRLISLMAKNPEINFEIRGHTDNIGSDAYNLTLSENRAKVVYDYLVSKGIASSRLIYKGYGSKFPIADNASEEGRALNRRTEFRVKLGVKN
jgi:outer membrane protein OmpA-like peptidoglycan-associated protein/tetratricopeptide (TPR) repeat protein